VKSFVLNSASWELRPLMVLSSFAEFEPVVVEIGLNDLNVDEQARQPQ
jgi:hypothetical protein